MVKTFYGFSTDKITWLDIRSVWNKLNKAIIVNHLEQGDKWIKIGRLCNGKYFAGIPIYSEVFTESITIDCDEYEMLHYRGDFANIVGYAQSVNAKDFVEIYTSANKRNELDILVKR